MRSQKRTMPDDQLRLIPLSRDHAGAMFRWMCDPAVSDNVGLRSTPSLARTEQWIDQALADESTVPLAIELAGTHVGNVVLDRIDRHLSSARLSIYVGESSVRGKHVGRRAVSLAVGHAFDELGLNKVWLTVHAHNAPAIAAYTAAGFSVEGVLRDEFVLHGRRCAAFYMSVLRNEVCAVRQAA
jgi:RimJ/RimL family protein N-acetyltransferase